jgi:hypothetical protein
MSETYVYLTSNQLKIYLEALWAGNVNYGTYKKISERIILDSANYSDIRGKYLESVSSAKSQTPEPGARTIEAYEALPEKI